MRVVTCSMVETGEGPRVARADAVESLCSSIIQAVPGLRRGRHARGASSKWKEKAGAVAVAEVELAGRFSTSWASTREGATTTSTAAPRPQGSHSSRIGSEGLNADAVGGGRQTMAVDHRKTVQKETFSAFDSPPTRLLRASSSFLCSTCPKNAILPR